MRIRHWFRKACRGPTLKSTPTRKISVSNNGMAIPGSRQPYERVFGWRAKLRRFECALICRRCSPHTTSSGVYTAQLPHDCRMRNRAPRREAL
jgi:hypothetical protein